MLTSELTFEGWKLIGSFPKGDPDGVGSWLLHHNGEAALVEIPPGLTVAAVTKALGRKKLVFATASHEHEDHFDQEAWERLKKAFPEARFILPGDVFGDSWHSVGGTHACLIKAPKHSRTDVVVVFRGVAMTGDIELGQLKSVNREVSMAIRKASMGWLSGFQERAGYDIHTVFSAHLNDIRRNVNWPGLFAVS